VTTVIASLGIRRRALEAAEEAVVLAFGRERRASVLRKTQQIEGALEDAEKVRFA
jgi:hypothetical protein